MPYKKNKITDMSNFSLKTLKIPFSLPIMHELATILRVEFIKAYEGSLFEGALVIQTETEIWIQNTSSGRHYSLTEGAMASIRIQRGYNSRIYFCD